jgi:hypothetical protein
MVRSFDKLTTHHERNTSITFDCALKGGKASLKKYSWGAHRSSLETRCATSCTPYPAKNLS